MKFNVEVQVAGHTLDVTGTMSPYRPATRWEPAEGGEVEILSASMVRRRRLGVGYDRRPLCPDIMEGLQDRDIDDKVREALRRDDD